MSGDEKQAIARLKEHFEKYGRHLRGCKIRPDSPIMRALAPRGEPFVPVPCSCGFDDARKNAATSAVAGRGKVRK